MTRFLKKDDYKPLIKDAYLQQIIREDEALLHMAEDAAIAEMKPYLSGKFDVADIFKGGENRHPLLVLFCVDIALYHLMASVEHPKLNDAEGLRYKRYERAIAWLEQVRRGDITPEGLIAEQPKADAKIYFKSTPKRENYY